jgi:choline-sulfatase
MRVNRKDFLRTAATLPLAASALPGASPASPAQASGQTAQSPGGGSPRRPNVLFLFSDQHRWDYLSCAGNPLVPTPELDRIAARGVRFSRAVCPYPVCAASRMSLLTGRYAHATGVINNTDRLPWNARTVAHHFADAGYHTGLIGKMHFNDAHTHGFQFMMGFNDWFQTLGPKVQGFADEIANHPIGPQFFRTVDDDGSGLPELPDLWEGKSPWAGHVNRIPWVGSQLQEEDQFDVFVARETCRFLRTYKDEPFFLVAGFLRPHPPLHPPRAWADRYPLDKIQVPPPGDLSNYPKGIRGRIQRFQQLGEERLRAHRAGYLGNLAFLDHCVGLVYRQLEELGLLENTIVVYTSDHGDMDGQNGLYQKFCLYDPSINVPLIVSQPGTLPQGQASHAETEYLGLYPTLAELAGLPVPAAIDARSFAGILRHPDAKGPDACFSEFNLRQPSDAYTARSGRWKYIYTHGDIDELYDLEADPAETRNLLVKAPGQHQREHRQMKDRLFAWFNPANNRYRPRPAEA